MEFTLKYRGDLAATGNEGGKVKEKFTMRHIFHNQLKRVWQTHNVLRHIQPQDLPSPTPSQHDRWDLPRPLIAHFDMDLQAFMFKYTVRGLTFVPLVTFPMEAHCYLAIRIGRPARPGSIFYGKGDIDGRIKTVIDALRMPHQDTELPVDAVGDEYNYCLLADDNLITRLSITSYRLLDGYDRDSFVDLDIDVTIRAITPMSGNWALLY